jgi:hypothetical protein
MSNAAQSVLESLLGLNSWALSVAPDAAVLARAIRRDDPAFRAARREATLQRLRQSSRMWQLWTLGMQALSQPAQASLTARTVWAGLAACDFGGEWFGDLDLAGRTFAGAVFGQGLVCRGSVWANACQFEAGIDLGGAQIGGALILEQSRFDAAVRAPAAQIGGAIEMRGAHLAGGLDLSRAQIGGDVWARDGVQIGVETRCVETGFGAEAGFGDAHFAGAAIFRAATFNGNAGFEGALFADAADFSDAVFCRSAWFAGADFEASVRFDRARLRGRFDLTGARFAEPAAQADIAKAVRDSSGSGEPQ